MTSNPERWIAAGGDIAKLKLYESVGRMAVFADGDSRCMAGIHPDLPDVGAVGDWVGSSGVRLAAESWLRSEGATTARGPMELCTWFPYRASLGPDTDAPFAMEPTDDPERWLNAGYAEAAHYLSAEIDHDSQIKKAWDHAANLAAKGWRVEALEADEHGQVSEGRFREVVGIMHSISLQAFSTAYGFAPIPEEALQAWYAPYRTMVDPKYVFIAFAPSGDIGGFVFALPDFAQPERGWMLVKTLAVKPEYQGIGLGWWLIAAPHKVARDNGLPMGVHCLMQTDSQSNNFTRDGDRIFRRYSLFEKPL